MRGASGDDVIYRREECKGEPAIWKAPGAEEEVDTLLNTLQSNFGGYYLEVQKIERMQKEERQSAFEAKKKTLEQRSEQSQHWKYDELDPVKREMRNILLGEEKVLEKTVYVGLDHNTLVKGISETGFATTKCRNNWFATGHYVTTKPWYAARYGLDGCYDGNGGILDPRSETAVGKKGRLLVCRAVMSNVYPITRECEEDHAIKDFADAAKQGKPWSNWYDEGSDKGRAMKSGYDAHYIRVKKMDDGTYSNFQACQDVDVLKKHDVEIADEMVILEETQLLAEYIVIFHVSKQDPEGVLMHIKLPQLEMECWSSSCSAGSSSTDISNSSTIKALDSPRKVSVLLVFAESKDQDQNYMYHKRDILRNKGFTDTSLVVIKDSLDLMAAVDDRQPSIVYIEGPPSQEWPLPRNNEDLHLVEEFVLMLAGPAGREWSQWRGCVLNFGAAKQDIVEKVCNSHIGKLNFLTWARNPSKSEMDRLWKVLFGIKLCYPSAEAFPKVSDSMMPEMLVKEAFEKAALATACAIPDKLVNAAVKYPSLNRQEQPFSHQVCSVMCSVLRLSFNFAIKGDKGALKRVEGAMASSGLQFTNATLDAKVYTEPDIDMAFENMSNDTISDFEQRNVHVFPEKVRSNGIGFRGSGCFHLRMDIKAFDWLCTRVESSDEPLYFELPMAWGGGEVRVKKVLPGDTCWFEAVAHADDVHAVCRHLREELTKGNDHEKKETSLSGNDQELRAILPGEQGALEGFWCDSASHKLKLTAMGSHYYFETITERFSLKVRGMLTWEGERYHGALMKGNHKSGYKVEAHTRLCLQQGRIMMTLQGTPKLFGHNGCGQTDLPDLGGKKVVSAAAGGNHTVLLLEDGTAKIFGNNSDGQTSLPDLGGKKVVSAAAGVHHTILLLEDGTANIFGDNDCGQTSLPDLGGKKVVSAAAGGKHTVLLLEDGTAKIFGSNRCGQTSLPDLGGKKVVSAAAGANHTVLLLEDGTAKIFGDNCFGQTSLPDLGGKKVVSAAAGSHKTVLLLEDGTAKIFGHTRWDHRSLPDLRGKKVVSAAAGTNRTVLLLEDGTAKDFGDIVDGQTSLPDLDGKKVVSAAAGYDHIVLLLKEEDSIAHPQKAEISIPAGPWVAGSVFEVRIQEQPSNVYMLKAHITKALTGDLVETFTISKHTPIDDLRDVILKRAQESSNEAVKQVKFFWKDPDITEGLDKHSKLSNDDQLMLHLSGTPSYSCDGASFEADLSKYGADEFEKYARDYQATPSLILAETTYLWAEILMKSFMYLQIPQPKGAGLSLCECKAVQERWDAEILAKWNFILAFEEQKALKEPQAKDPRWVNDACEKVLLRAMEQQGHEQADLLPYKGALARCWLEMGRHEKAEAIFRQNLEVQEAQCGPTDLSTLASKNIFAAFLTTECRRYAEAEPIIRQSLEIYEKELGLTHPSTLDCRNEFAKLLRHMGKHHEAESLLRQRLVNRSKGKGGMKGEGKGKGKRSGKKGKSYKR